MFRSLLVTLLIIGSSARLGDKFKEFYPSLPLNEQTAKDYVAEYKTFFNYYYSGGNIATVINKIYDENVIVCAMPEVCTVGRSVALSELQDFQTGLQQFRLLSLKFNYVNNDDYSVSTQQHPIFIVGKKFGVPAWGFDGNGEQGMEVHSNVSFNTHGLITLIENDYGESLFDEYKAAFFRLFSGFKTKKQAVHQANVLNGITVHDSEIPEDDKLFGMDKDVVTILTAIASIIAICIITLWFLYLLCCRE